LLYRVRKTLLQMLKDRGYIVSEKKLNQNKTDFAQAYENQILNSESLNTLVEKRQTEDEGSISDTQKLAVFFPNVDKLNKAALTQITLKMIDINAMSAIIVVKGSTNIAKKVFTLFND
jgi:DNA-directed RNA polymerase I, II, and III subunit RPABC1